MMTLSAAPRPIYGEKAETLSFLHVLLVWGINILSFFNYLRTNYEVVFLRSQYSENCKFTNKEIN